MPPGTSFLTTPGCVAQLALGTGQVVADPEQAELRHFACAHPSPLAPSLLARTRPQNDIGYQVIAETVAAALKASLGPVSID